MADGAARALLAGFIVGYGVAIAITAVAAVMLVRLRPQVQMLERAIAPALSPLAVAVPVSLFAFLLWTAVGMLFGAAFYALERALPGGGLGSPNVAYTLIVLATGVVLAAPWLALLRPLRPYLAAALAAYVVLFGWALPHLAR